MKLDYMILANYAEAPAGLGLVNMLGGGWDTINVTGPIEHVPPGLPPDIVAIVQGSLAARVLFHPTEVGKDRALRIVIVDEDGGEVGKIEGQFRADKQPGLPPGWQQGVNMVFGLTGIPLRRFGLYRISLLLDEQHLGDREFRVLKLY